VSDYEGSEQLMVPGTLRGYRAWRPFPGGLMSMVDSYPWARHNVARCARFGGFAVDDHIAPVSECTCGFYARHTLKGVENLYRNASVFGSIKAHGRIVLGTKGFRAEEAEIEALLLDPIKVKPGSLSGWYDGPTVVGLLQRAYVVPVYTDREELLKDFPPIPVDHLLPPESAPEPWTSKSVTITLSDEQAANIWKLLTGQHIEEEQ
jgi:hypothetical protein